jgi:hypothetical protein
MRAYLGLVCGGTVLTTLGAVGMALVVAISAMYARCTSRVPYVTGCSPANPATAELSLILLLMGVVLLVVGSVEHGVSRRRAQEAPELKLPG